MKKILLVSFVLLSMTAMSQRNYCNGWTDGFIAGWCLDEKGSNCRYPSPVPACPEPREGESYLQYMDGYDRAVVIGVYSKMAWKEKNKKQSGNDAMELYNQYYTR